MSSIAVNMMVLNGALVLRRCLLPFKGIVNELVVVDTGSMDGTFYTLAKLAIEIGAVFKYFPLDPFSDGFFTDEATSFRLPMPGPFTGRRVPRRLGIRA